MTRSLTLSDAVWPVTQDTSTLANRATRSVVLAIVFSAIIGLLAHVQIKLGFTPVPITGQTLGVLLVGALLGPRLGMATIALYIVEGYAGLPVFASAASAASTGYLFGFLPAAGMVGWLAEKRFDRSVLTTAVMMASGSIVIYTCGVTVLSHFVGGFPNALKLGVLPFIPGDLIKASIASALLPLGWKLVGNRPGQTDTKDNAS